MAFHPVSTLKHVARSAVMAWIDRHLRGSPLKVMLVDESMGLVRPVENSEELLTYLHRGKVSIDSYTWMQQLEQWLPVTGTVFDVGAFKGITAQWFARTADRVFAFDPIPAHVAQIERTARVRNLHNLRVFQRAMSEERGEREFHVTETASHSSLGRVQTSKIVETIKVPVETIDGFAKAEGVDTIDLLKLDVEGYELEALKGAETMIRDGKIAAILFEVSTEVLASLGREAAPVFEFLRSHDYDIFTIDGRPAEVGQVNGLADFVARKKNRAYAA